MEKMHSGEGSSFLQAAICARDSRRVLGTRKLEEWA